ncbi:hypothetical protein GQ53DRAFT_742664 [Thozetella sp. PMI_491]|nr:hypothetical protein GQ53DRAFT_742664 [Thozetella sp. PMI_491]
MAAIDTRVLEQRMVEFAAIVQREVLMKRGVDHRALETLAVVATCIFGVGGFIYWCERQK